MSTGVDAIELHLLVNDVPNPIGISTADLVFRWVALTAVSSVSQRSFRVTVAQTADDLSSPAQALCDSGLIADTAQFWRPPGELGLKPSTEYLWRIEVTFAVGAEEVRVTASGTFETTLLSPDDWSDSSWIAGTDTIDESAAAPLLRREFTVEERPSRARLYLAAGGIAVVQLNGADATGEELGPGFADYDQRVQFSTHDVTSLLVVGANVFACELGRGFYGLTTENTWDWHHAPWHSNPCVRAVLLIDYPDGRRTRVSSGPGFRTSDGPTVRDSLYEGEIYDSRYLPAGWSLASFDDAHWRPAAIVAGPRGQLVARPQPPVRIIERMPAADITALSGGRYVVRFSRQIAGWCELRVDAPAGDEIVLRYGEVLDERGSVQLASPFTAGDLQTDRYIGNGRRDTWSPRFSYKGFQYVEVSGWPEDSLSADAITAIAVHTDASVTSTFECSNPLLTSVHRAVVATMQNNLHHIPTDTPVFEKNGWTGDAQLAADMMLRDLDSVTLMAKWLDDVSDSRTPDGRPALIAPTPGWMWPDRMESPTWHAAYVLVPWRIYWATGDDHILRRHYDGMLAYLRLEHRMSIDHLSTTGLGDYLAPDSSGNPDEDPRVSATAYVYEMTCVMGEISAHLGRPDDAAEMRSERDAIRRAFMGEFFDVDAGDVRDHLVGFRQTHNVLAVAAGLLSPEDEQSAADSLARDIIEVRDSHLWVGALGVRRLLPVLADHGYVDLAYTVATQPTYPGWGAWIVDGSTTLWEHWDGRRSRNHFFLGTIDDWLFSSVIGILPIAPGYDQVIVKPDSLADLTSASGTIKTAHGTLSVRWQRTGASFELFVDAPVGCSGSAILPDGRNRAFESGKSTWTCQLATESTSA